MMTTHSSLIATASAWALAGFAGLASAGVSGLGFVSGYVSTDAFGSVVFSDTGDVSILNPMPSFYSAIETDQGFASAQGEASVANGRSMIGVQLSANGTSVINMEVVFQIPEATEFILDSSSFGSIVFEPVTGSLNYDGNFDWGEGIISAGTYRLSVSGFGGDAAESFQIQLNREFPLVCTADINADGLLNFFDVAAYIVRYNSNDPAADLTAPFGTLNFFDMSSFITLYNAGCP